MVAIAGGKASNPEVDGACLEAALSLGGTDCKWYAYDMLLRPARWCTIIYWE